MKQDELKAYVQALEDVGVYKQSDPADAEFEQFVADLELKQEVEDTGNWLVRVYRDHGTIFEKEHMRIFMKKDGTVTAGLPLGEGEILVGPNSVIRMFMDKLVENYRPTKLRKGEARIRENCKESEDAGDKF